MLAPCLKTFKPPFCCGGAKSTDRVSFTDELFHMWKIMPFVCKAWTLRLLKS